MLFKSIADEHVAKQEQKRAKIKQLERKIVDQSLPALADAIFADVNASSEKIIENQKEIDRECKKLKDNWIEFNKHLSQWNQLVADLDTAIKGIGDVSSWARDIEKQVNEIVQNIENKQ